MRLLWAALLASVVGTGCTSENTPHSDVLSGWTEASSDLAGAGPNVTLAASSTHGAAPLSVYFDGTHSRPAPDASWITACGLDYGDGQSTTNCWGIHTYAAGAWTAVFTVTDNLGRSAQARLDIQVTGAPIADAGGVMAPRAVLTASPTQGVAPQLVYFDGTTSKPAPDGSWITACQLEYGDGQSTTNCWGIHTYAAGFWTAQFTATDNRGRSATATQELTIRSTQPVDAGSGPPDAGTPDAGSPPPSGKGWTIWGAQQGGPTSIYGATSDEAGNIWVAGGPQGLYLLAPGSTAFRRFTVSDGLTGVNDGSGLRTQSAISVVGGPAGTVFVGYQGLPGCEDALYVYNFNPAYRYLWKSGDADRVTLTSAGIAVAHYDISSGPGVVAAEPQGREKLCSVLRLGYHAATGSVWFGGNHGVAWGNANSTEVVEHTHPAINGYIAVRNSDGTAAYHYTLLTDLYYGIAPLANGDLWVGGANRSALFRWASLGRSFWSADTDIQHTKVDFWPDAVPLDAYPNQRTDDLVTDMAAYPDGTVWASSVQNGLVHWGPNGTTYLVDRTVEPNGKATALERDPSDGSLWVGFIWGGLTRIQSGVSTPYDARIFGALVNGKVVDLQSDSLQGQRRLLVSFAGQSGVPAALAVYTGP